MKALMVVIVAISIMFIIWCVLKISGTPTSINLLPSFLPGEKVLFFKSWVWACSGRSGKSWSTYYRWSFSVPPLMETGLYVTNRRVLYVNYIFRGIKFEFNQWFRGKGKPDDNEFVKEVNVGKSRIFGPYLEVISENSVKRQPQSQIVRLRLFMKNPDSVRGIIAEAMLQNHQDSQ